MPADELLIDNVVAQTMDDHASTATSVLIRDGVIAAVGATSQVAARASTGAERFDGRGRTLLPGFIDAHNHLSNAAFEPVAVDCSGDACPTIDDVLQAVSAFCRDALPGQWVRGFGFHASQVREQRNPTRDELDAAAPQNPFFLQESNVHAGYANSLALDAVGITEHTPQPWGGEFVKDERGRLTGTLLEAAVDRLQTASWSSYARRDWDAAVGLLEAKAREYLAVGITGVGDACVTPLAAELYRRADLADRLPLTVQQLHGGDDFFARQDIRRPDVVERILADESNALRGGVMKVFMDRAYPDGPMITHRHDGCTTHAGSAFYTPDEVRELAVRASAARVGLAIHAMGNGAVEAVADAYEQVRRRAGDEPVLRMEHAFVAGASQAPRLASLGIDLVANPGLGFNDGQVFDSWRGADDPDLRVLPLRSMIDAGVRVSFASDHPCGGFSPAEIMWAAVSRQQRNGEVIDPDEAVTPIEALRAYTINAAHASGRAHEEGSIEVGKRANLVLVDRDPLTCTTDAMRSMRVERTLVDGRVVFAAEQE